MQFTDHLKKTGTSLVTTAFLALFMACGGGGGKDESPAGVLKVTLTGGTVEWAAFQDGHGEWKPVDLKTGSASLTVKDGAGRYGFAIGTGTSTRWIDLWHATLAERPVIDLNFLPARVNLTISNLTGCSSNERILSALGKSWSQSWSLSKNTYTLSCPPVTADLAVKIADSTNYQEKRFWIQRGFSLQADTTHPGLDLSSAVNMRPVQLTATNIPSGSVLQGYHTFRSAGGTATSGYLASAAPSGLFVSVVDGSQLITGDIQFLSAMATQSTPTPRTQRTGKYFRTTPAGTFDLPSPLTASMSYSTAADAIQAQWQAVPGANYYAGSLNQANGLNVSANFTTGWLGTGTNLAYTTPNLQAIAPGWNFVAGSSVAWSLTAYGTSYGVLVPQGLQPFKDGDWFWSSQSRGTVSGIPGTSLSPAIEALTYSPWNGDEPQEFR